jgi:tetratricopeptide (TPR) repeat protein
MGRFDQALEVYDEAVQLFPHNVIARSGRAEVLKAMGRFDQALKAYGEAVQLFPRHVIARSGRAEVLKAMGRFEQALEAYDETVQLFPHDAIARNGRAEVLKAMGRFDQALKAYDEAVQLFPRHVIARSGRAEVLKAMGRFDQALKAYDEGVQLFPHDAIARNGRAEVLKAMGRFDQALASYLETQKLFSHNPYTLCGAASVLLLMGRLEEAKLLLLPDSSPVSQGDWVKYHIMAMIYMKTEGSLDEAVRRLSHGVQHAPWRESKHVFMNSLAVASIKKQEYVAALEVLKQDIGVLDIVEKQKRLALMSHSQAAIGRTDEAIQSLDGLADVEDPNLLMLRSFLSQRYGLREQWKPAVASISMPILDLQIAQKEFLIALA